jgi:hypothetical protein
VLIVLKSGSLNLLEPSGPVQACNGIALHTQFYRFLIVPYFSKFDWYSVQCVGFFYITFKKFGLFVELERDPYLNGCLKQPISNNEKVMCIYLLIYSLNLHYTQNLGLFYDRVHSSVLFACCYSFILILFLFLGCLNLCIQNVPIFNFILICAIGHSLWGFCIPFVSLFNSSARVTLNRTWFSTSKSLSAQH